VLLLLCYVGLSAFSLLLLPVRQIVKDLWYFGFPDGFSYLFIGPPYSFYYPVVAVIRLMLFVVLALEIAKSAVFQENFKFLFSGIFSGAVFCAIIGLLDFYGIISLGSYRFGVTSNVQLQSTFLNRGWLAEYIMTAVPFVLIGFMGRIRGLWWKVLLFVSLIICEVTLLLAGARAGWVAYPLILFICWLFFYFSKEDRLESVRFSWKDLLKIGISVPVTIIISFILVFQVFLPLSDYLRENNVIKGGGKNSNQITQYLKHRVTGLKKRIQEVAGTHGVKGSMWVEKAPSLALGMSPFAGMRIYWLKFLRPISIYIMKAAKFIRRRMILSFRYSLVGVF